MTTTRSSSPPQLTENLRRNPPIILTVPEASIYSTLSQRTLWQLISERKLKVRRIGARVLIRLQDMEAFLNTTPTQSIAKPSRGCAAKKGGVV